MCGWSYRGPTFRARRRELSSAFRTMASIQDIPGCMVCDRCLPTERSLALHLLEGELALMSGDHWTSLCTEQCRVDLNQDSVH